MTENIKINNLLDKDYHAPCIIIVAGDSKTEFETPELLNGYADEETDYNELVLEGEDVKFFSTSLMNLIWNRVDSKLYTVNRFVIGRPISEELLRKLGGEVSKQWSEGAGSVFAQTAVTEYEEKEVFVSPWHSEQDLHVTIIPVEIPEKHYWLGTIFDTPEKQLMYEDFMCDPIVNKKINKQIDAQRIEIPEGVNRENTPELPIHKKDKTTGEILISDAVLQLFLQYQFAQNYVRGFEPGTVEFDAGKLMMLYPRFCEFMMKCAEDAANEKEIHDFDGNYQRELAKAIKYVQKDGGLLHIFENWSDAYSPKEDSSEVETAPISE